MHRRGSEIEATLHPADTLYPACPCFRRYLFQRTLGWHRHNLEPQSIPHVPTQHRMRLQRFGQAYLAHQPGPSRRQRHSHLHSTLRNKPPDAPSPSQQSRRPISHPTASPPRPALLPLHAHFRSQWRTSILAAIKHPDRSYLPHTHERRTIHASPKHLVQPPTIINLENAPTLAQIERSQRSSKSRARTNKPLPLPPSRIVLPLPINRTTSTRSTLEIDARLVGSCGHGEFA